MRRLSVAVSVLAALAAAIVAVPSGADVAAVHDPRRDAPARYDLTKVRVKNTDARFALTAHVRDLRGGRKQIFVFRILSVRGQDTWSFQTVRPTNGTATAQLVKYTEDEAVRVKCEINRAWKLGKDTIRVSFDRACVDQSGAVRVNTAIGRGNGNAGDPADWTRPVRVRQG